jgi:hypothetical protein
MGQMQPLLEERRPGTIDKTSKRLLRSNNILLRFRQPIRESDASRSIINRDQWSRLCRVDGLHSYILFSLAQPPSAAGKEKWGGFGISFPGSFDPGL